MLRQDPGNWQALNNLSYRLLESKTEFPRALSLAKRAVGIMPQHGQLRDTLAMALSANGEHEAAAAEARQALLLDKKDPWLAVRAARVFLRAGCRKEARRAAVEAEARAGPEEQAALGREVRVILRAVGPK